MNVQEVIEVLQNERDSLAVARGNDYSGVKAIEYAISALEKQIPVKATFDSDMDYVECPVCCQLTNANGFPEDINYCYHCGQAFDWEGEE